MIVTCQATTMFCLLRWTFGPVEAIGLILFVRSSRHCFDTKNIDIRFLQMLCVMCNAVGHGARSS